MNRNLPNWMKSSKYPKFYSGTVLLLFTFAIFIFFNALLKIKTQYSLEQFYPQNHSLLTEDDRIKSRFKLASSTPIIVLLESQKKTNWVEPEDLKRLSMLTKSIKKMENVEDVKSLANIETAISDETSFTVGSLKDFAKDPLQREQILSNPLIAPHLVSNDGKVAAIIITTKRLSFIQRSHLLKNIDLIANNHKSFFSAKISGPTAISTQIATLLQSEILKCSALSLLVSALVFFVMFRNFSVIPMGLCLVICANIVALGSLSLLGIELNMLSSTLPIIITLVVVAITTQTLARLGEFKNKVLHQHRHIVLIRVLKELIGPHTLAAAATSIGFASLMNSDTPLIRDYGLSVTISVMITCLVTLLLISGFSILLPLPVKRQYPLSSEFAAQFITRHRHSLFTGILAVVILLALMGRDLNWSPLLFDDLKSHHPVRQAIMSVDKNLGGSIPLEVSLGKKGQADLWKNPESIKKLDELIITWRKKPGVGSVVGITDFLKATQNQRQLASTQQAISEKYFIFSMASENPLETFLTSDNSYTRVALRLEDVPALQMQGMVSEFKAQAHREFPNLDIETGGIASTLHPINESLSRELIYGCFAALLWILFMLVFVFRSIRWTIFSALPNLVPPAILLGALAISKTPIKPSIAIIFAISLGIAFNNTVYIFLKLRRMIKKQQHSDQLPVLKLMREELGPCFISSCAVMSGFSVFLFSEFAMNQIFGGFMILSVVAGLLGDLVFLPTLLYIFPSFLLGRSTSETLTSPEESRFDLMNPSTQKYIAGFLLIIGIGLISQKALGAATPSAQDILKQVGKANQSPYEHAEIKMKIQEADGTTKERTLSIKKKSDKENKAMVKLLSPSDLKGVSLLTVSSGQGNENQWLYLPSEKKSRRIVGSNKKGRFLDSELNYEDLSPSTYENFNNKVVQSKDNLSVIESTAKPDSESSYSKIKTWINTADHRIMKAEYYDEDGELLKIMTFNGYKKYKNLWRAQNINVKNVKKNRSTILEMKKFSVKKIDDGEFSMSALEEG